MVNQYFTMTTVAVISGSNVLEDKNIKHYIMQNYFSSFIIRRRQK